MRRVAVTSDFQRCDILAKNTDMGARTIVRCEDGTGPLNRLGSTLVMMADGFTKDYVLRRFCVLPQARKIFNDMGL